MLRSFAGACVLSALAAAPAAPPSLRTFDVLAARSLVFAGRTDGLAVVDLADPIRPRSVARLSVKTPVLALAASGDRLALAAGRLGCVLVDASDPEKPRILGSWNETGSVVHVALAGDVAFLTGILVALDIVLAGLFWALVGEDNVPAQLIRKVLYVGFFALLLNNFSSLADIIFRSFAGLGLKASAASLTAQDLMRPGFVADTGFTASRPLLDKAGELIGFTTFFNNFVTITVLMQLEDLGFCEKGQGGKFVSDGNLISGVGKLPFNTDGGGLCNNHPTNRVGITRGTLEERRNPLAIV